MALRQEGAGTPTPCQEWAWAQEGLGWGGRGVSLLTQEDPPLPAACHPKNRGWACCSHKCLLSTCHEAISECSSLGSGQFSPFQDSVPERVDLFKNRRRFITRFIHYVPIRVEILKGRGKIDGLCPFPYANSLSCTWATLKTWAYWLHLCWAWSWIKHPHSLLPSRWGPAPPGPRLSCLQAPGPYFIALSRG